jgi:hypothetical protein
MHLYMFILYVRAYAHTHIFVYKFINMCIYIYTPTLRKVIQTYIHTKHELMHTWISASPKECGQGAQLRARVRVNVCVCVCVCVGDHAARITYILSQGARLCARVYVHVCVCIYVCVCDHAARHIYVRSCTTYIHTFIHACIHTTCYSPVCAIDSMQEQTHTHIHMHTYTCTPVYKYIHMFV